jgi:hypothetical protein
MTVSPLKGSVVRSPSATIKFLPHTTTLTYNIDDEPIKLATPKKEPPAKKVFPSPTLKTPMKATALVSSTPRKGTPGRKPMAKHGNKTPIKGDDVYRGPSPAKATPVKLRKKMGFWKDPGSAQVIPGLPKYKMGEH